MPETIKILTNNNESVLERNIPSKVEEAIDRALTWTNLSIKFENERNPYRKKDPEQHCYKKKTKSFATGLLPKVIKVIQAEGYNVEIREPKPSVEPTKLNMPSWAYPHQEMAVEVCLSNPRCIIQSPTGSGKSYMIAMLCNHFPTANILITVPRSTLLHGMVKTLKVIMPDEAIGKVGDNNSTWERITVGITNSLSRHAKGKFSEHLAKVDVLIADEVHRTASPSCQEICLAASRASYRYGFSATVKRKDGAEILIEGALGSRALTISEENMVKEGHILKPSCYFIETPEIENVLYKNGVMRKGKVVYNTPDAKPDRAEVYERCIVNNLQRNRVVVYTALEALRSTSRKGVVLVLVERIEHGQTLQTMFADAGLEVDFLSGSTNTTKRMETLDKFRTGEKEILIASTILDEGEDIPRLEIGILAGGGSNEKNTIQRIGRMLRKDNSIGKDKAIIFDFYDNERYWLKSNSEWRMHYITARYPESVKVIKPIDISLCLSN